MMKKNDYFAMAGMLLLAVAGVFSSCTTNDGLEDAEPRDMEYAALAEKGASDDSSVNGGEEGTEPNGNTQAGIVTAGEWCDLDHWPFWSGLMVKESSDNEPISYADKSDYWKFYTNNRVAVEVSDGSGKAVAGVTVSLQRGGTTLWEAVTDNHGKAECWLGLFQRENGSPSDLTIALNGQRMDSAPVISHWDVQAQPTINKYVYNKADAPKLQADIAFIVDATGSMTDEINFLKSDLEDIIDKVASVRPDQIIRTAALFYRDEGDEYVTRPFNFTNNLKKIREFIGQQHADGGGDYPEAVHTALERSLQDLSWDTSARTRLAFLILDAPAHYETKVIESLQQSIKLFAKQGIRLIPVAASGVDKNTEFMLRFFAAATGGTYVFLTDHSGVGNSHIAATVGEYEVELLNSLIIRLISQYTE